MSKGSGSTAVCFVKEETVKGTAVEPAGTDVLPIIGDVAAQQMRTTAESLVRVNSYSITELLSLRYGPLSFTIPFYMFRTGVNDTVVAGIDTILKNVMGRKTTNAGANTTYNLYRVSPLDPLLTFTMFYKVAGVLLQCEGCFVNDFTLSFQADPAEAAIHRAAAAGSGYRIRWAGTTVSTEALVTTDAGLTMVKIAAADLTPNDHATTATIAGKFTVGARIKVGALTTAHKITAINPTTGVMIVTPAFGSSQISGSVVDGWVPVSSLSGAAISAHRGLKVYNSLNWPEILAGSLHIVNPRRALVEEKNNQDYATDDAWEGFRHITLDGIRAYFDPRGTYQQDLSFAIADRLQKYPVTIDIGNEVGRIFQFSLPNTILRDVAITGAGIVELGASAQAVATAALDDELSIISK